MKPLSNTGKKRTSPFLDGKQGWQRLDKRGKAWQEWHRRYGVLVNALGGEKDLSPQGHVLAGRATSVNLLLETLQLKLAQGQLDYLPQYLGLAQLELSLYRALGLKRVPKQVGLQAKLLEAQEAADLTPQHTTTIKEETT